MANIAATNTTKSIDVGSMFLMDLSVHESELSSDPSDAVLLDNEHVFPSASTHALKLNTNSFKLNESKRSNYANQSLLTQNKANHTKNETQQHPLEDLSSSLDRLADAIYFDDRSRETVANGSSVTVVEPQPLPDIVDQSSASLSDESFVTSSSSGGSSIGGAGNSLSSSYTRTSDPDDEERGSTTTREDSGVLDMKDLDSQLNNSYDNEHDVEFCHHNQRVHKEKPISNDITATNLINKSANNHNTFKSQYTSNRHNKPTNSNHHHHNYNQRSQSSKRSMSASLPIQVPARQMKKDLNKLKLDMIRDGWETTTNNATITTAIPATSTIDDHGENGKHLSACAFHHSKQCTVADDFDEFLEQEYNDNHQNHYPIDKYDGEHLRADENPMKLFESIQALARSLHEDAELFGSLPPKRMLESPIRSIALA